MVILCRHVDTHSALCKHISVDADLPELVASWRVSLVAQNKAPGTVGLYTHIADKFSAWAEGREPTLKMAQEWIAHLLQSGMSPTTARMRVVALRAWGRWLTAEGEIPENIFAALIPPKSDTKVVPALSEDEVSALLRTCRGGGLLNVRDEAIMRFMFETGVRSHELLALTVEDLDIAGMTAVVRRGKGGKGRIVPFHPQTAEKIDRYIRVRKRFARDGVTRLWVSRHGKALSYDGLRHLLRRRAGEAGVKDFHPHRARHTAATRWLRSGGSEGGLMAVAGWSSRSMLDRYTAHSASERALAEARKLGIGLE